MENNDPLTERIIGCAIALHRSVGPGLSEQVYQRGLAIELEFNGLRFTDRPRFGVFHRARLIGEFYPDFIVEDQIVVEIKSASAFDRVFEAQVLTYLRVAKLRRGLLLNFGRPLMRDGIQRFVQG